MAAKTTVETIANLIAETSSSLPEDALAALRRAKRREDKGSPAEKILSTILGNCALAAKNGTPLCQDTGTLAFYIDERLKRRVSPEAVREAVALATERGMLRRNCIDPLSGASIDDNRGEGSPQIHYVAADGARAGVTLLMKGGGSENMSRQYSLPDAALAAGRDLEGVRKCVLDAVVKAQGCGCAPGILGVCVGGDRASGFACAKRQLLRRIGERSPDKTLAGLERRLLADANSLGIGPMGLGGKTTLLDVKAAALSRVPASFFVTVAYMCWACRRRTAWL